MDCPPGGPRHAYCLLCVTHTPARHLTSPIHKMRWEIHRRAKAVGIAVPSSVALAAPEPVAAQSD
eukprot:9178948-Lingulodinium_polyedra.AAC.1